MNKSLLRENPKLLLTTIHAYALNDLDVEPNIKELIIDNKDLLNQIDPSELYLRFKEFMGTQNPDKYIREFKEVFFDLIPGLKETYGFNQNNPWHIYDVFEHTMNVIANTNNNEILRIAALFHDIGKPLVYTEEKKINEFGEEQLIGHFYNHQRASIKYFNDFAKKVIIPRVDYELITKLIIYHDSKLSIKPDKMKEYIKDLGIDNMQLLFDLKRADNLAQNPEKTKESLRILSETEKIFKEYIKTIKPIETPVRKIK